MGIGELTGDDLVKVLATLANPHRIRVIAALSQQRSYVSQMARDLGISRPLLQVHLRKLDAVGLVSATLEFSEDGKAMKYYEVTPFALHLSPETLVLAAETLTPAHGRPGGRAEGPGLMGDSWVLKDTTAITGLFVLLTIVITVGIRQYAGIRRARAADGSQRDYRKLAESALLLQENIGHQLHDIAVQLADLAGRVESMERILKEVE
jgi:DNA-binding transcriptional ArsR family regulator